MSNFFKNAIAYRLTEKAWADHDALVAAVEQFPHQLPGSLDTMRYGFVAPFDAQIVESAMGMTMIACKHSWRDLPSAVVNEEVAKKAKAIEEAESRSVGRKERQTLKDEVIFSMLPKAFIKHRITRALIIGDFVIVDSASHKRAEDLLSKLREALGSLRVLPVSVKMMPTQVMTNWIVNGASDSRIELGESCSLAAGKDGRVIRCKNQDLTASEVINHINSGMYATKVSAAIQDKASFDINEKLVFSRIKFSDLVDDRIAENNPETKHEQLTSTMIIAGAELKALLDIVIAEFGGETNE